MKVEDFASRLHVIRYIDDVFKKNNCKYYILYNYKTNSSSDRKVNWSIEEIIELLFKKNSKYEVFIPAIDKYYYSETVPVGILDEILQRMEERGVK